MSAARIPSSAEDRFCVWFCMTLTALWSRLIAAPMLPRVAATDWIAALMLVNAAWAAAAVVKPADPAPPAIVAPELKPIRVAVSVDAIALPAVPATLAVKVTLEAPATAEASTFAVVPVAYATPAPGPPLTAAAKLASVSAVVAPIATLLAARLTLAAATKV